jgi:pSer/pThr/pTyr-binding forkhead associated (FHA) protein
MPLQIDSFLVILRLLFIVLLYLFLMQVVIAITRDLKRGKSAAPMPTTLGHLIVVHSGPSNIAPGTSFQLLPQTTIGRGPTNTIRIQDQTVSAEHTRLSYQNGTWYVQDAGSSNGTFVNEQPAREPLPAKVGDVIRVGYIRFQLKP